MHGASSLLGQADGQESTVLTTDKMPSHFHSFSVDDVDPFVGNITEAEDPFMDLIYEEVIFDVVGGSPSAATSSTGGGDPDTNTQPSLGLNYIIALEGIFPSSSRRLEQINKSDAIGEEQESGGHRRLFGNQPLIGEIALFAGNFAPRGWAFCNGQLLPIFV